MKWGFLDTVAFAAVMTMRDINKENKRMIKTRKFYQDCCAQIGDNEEHAFRIAIGVAQKASRRYIPQEFDTGTCYLPLYAFALVIQKQGRVTSDQNKVIKTNFDCFKMPFSRDDYLNAARTGSEVGDFRKVIAVSKEYAGTFWVNFFRALYKSGTQKDLQDFVDCVTAIIANFAALGTSSALTHEICREFMESVNYQIGQVREISMTEIDWLGVIPVSERLKSMRQCYESLVDNSDITEEISRAELIPLLDTWILNGICDIVMMTRESKTVKLSMINDAADFVGIHTDITPEEYVRHIANDTEIGQIYKNMFSSGPPLGAIWNVMIIMCDKANRPQDAIILTNDMLSVFFQLESFLDEKYNFSGDESLAKKYMLHIFDQLPI